jgi:DNA-binding GntR family transcriptional regulator
MMQAQRDRRTLVARTREDLARRIRSGEFRAGEQLPSEPELARTYSVSRVTMREALKGLQQEHLLYAIHGRGTFVAPAPITRPITRLQSVTELVDDLGYTMTTRVLEARDEPASGHNAAALGVDEGTPLVRLERLRLVDDRPAIYSLDIFPASLVQGVPAELWQDSLFAYIEGHARLHIGHSTATIRAILLDNATSTRIGAKRGLPWLLLEQTNFTDSNRPLVYSLDYHHSEMFSFEVLRRRY